MTLRKSYEERRLSAAEMRRDRRREVCTFPLGGTRRGTCRRAGGFAAQEKYQKRGDFYTRQEPPMAARRCRPDLRPKSPACAGLAYETRLRAQRGGPAGPHTPRRFKATHALKIRAAFATPDGKCWLGFLQSAASETREGTVTDFILAVFDYTAENGGSSGATLFDKKTFARRFGWFLSALQPGTCP